MSFIRDILSDTRNKNDELYLGWWGRRKLSNISPNNLEYKCILNSINQLMKSGGDVAISFGVQKVQLFWIATQNVSVLFNTYDRIFKLYIFIYRRKRS